MRHAKAAPIKQRVQFAMHVWFFFAPVMLLALALAVAAHLGAL